MPSCIACGSEHVEHLIDLGSSPTTTGALHQDADEAHSVPCGRIDLVGCRTCGHVFNQAFEPTLVDYDSTYDNSLHFSPVFQAYADALATRLVTSYDLAGKHIVEIGSGRGDFLAVLTSLAAATGTGYDPSFTPDTERPGIRLVTDYFRPAHSHERYALLVCRHVLEHLDDPSAMLSALRADAPADSVYYLEVPAAAFCFGPSGMWDCIFPHVSYFCRTSLRHLVERCGFEILAEDTGFDGQYLWVEARPSDKGPSKLPAAEITEHLELLHGFSHRWNRTVTRWREEIGLSETPANARVLWGAGAKAVTFLNAVDPDGYLRVVDLNPRKWGRYLPGTGHLVQSPESVLSEPVSDVLITNPVYRHEIADHLKQMGVSARIIPV